jgi:Flp pilus assembly protein TadG
MIIKAREKGQALILITLAAIGLFAFSAIAIDGSRAYSNKRHAQNAADTAALAGALAYAREGNTDNIETVALARAQDNGYETNGTSTEVTVTVTDVPDENCPGVAIGKDIMVTIDSYVNTTFARIIGRDKLDSGATATSRACGLKFVPLFDGNAVVGLSNTSPCAFDTGNSSSVKWKVKGGGIFSNGCGFSKDLDTVTFDPGRCISTPSGTASGDWSCTPQPAHSYD